MFADDLIFTTYCVIYFQILSSLKFEGSVADFFRSLEGDPRFYMNESVRENDYIYKYEYQYK